MKKISLYLLVCLVAFSCTPDENVLGDSKDPEVEIPVDPDQGSESDQDQGSESDPDSDQGPLPVFESSYDAVANMGVGWNLGNTLESVWEGDTDGRDWEKWETGWGQYVTTPELMHMMKNAGFGAIRVPVTWGVHMDAGNNIYPEWMNRVNEVVDYVLNAGMYCIINIHHDTGADEKLAWLVASPEGYAKEKERYESIWRQVSERFRDYDHRLLFESFNEMLDESRSWCYASMNVGYDASAAADAYDAINAYAQTFVDVVRSTGGNNAVRNLVVNTYGACNGSGTWSPYLSDPLKNMKMPADKVEDHILFQVHSYPQIDDLSAMEAEVDDMLDILETYLEPLGGPVIVGEWGTFSENPPLENYCYYADYFVSEAKERGIGTFHWMSLSDGFYRSIPCFSHPDITESIVKGYHGEGFVPTIPVFGDYDVVFDVIYEKLWSEAHLCSKVLDLSDYKGISFELDQIPDKDVLHVKIYGEEDGKEQYVGIGTVNPYIEFDPEILGSKTTRVTLQCMIEGGYATRINSVELVRTDGTKEECMPSVFWGCTVEAVVL